MPLDPFFKSDAKWLRDDRKKEADTLRVRMKLRWPKHKMVIGKVFCGNQYVDASGKKYESTDRL